MLLVSSGRQIQTVLNVSKGDSSDANGTNAAFLLKRCTEQLFFPDGIALDGKRFVRTAVTTHAFNYLTCTDGSENQVASPTGFEPVFWP